MGALLLAHMNLTLPVKSLFFSGLDVALVLLAGTWAVRRIVGSDVDMRGHIPVAPPLRATAVVCIAAILGVWGHGLVAEDHVAVLGVHVVEVDLVAQPVAVEHAVLHNRDAIAGVVAVDRAGAHAAAGGVAAEDQRVYAQLGQVGVHRRAVEGGRPQLADDDLAGQRSELTEVAEVPGAVLARRAALSGLSPPHHLGQPAALVHHLPFAAKRLGPGGSAEVVGLDQLCTGIFLPDRLHPEHSRLTLVQQRRQVMVVEDVVGPP